jgi:parallel beta-helix repeat protein
MYIGNSHSNVVSYNNVTGFVDYYGYSGIYSYGSDSNTFFSNIVMNNAFGVYFESDLGSNAITGMPTQYRTCNDGCGKSYTQEQSCVIPNSGCTNPSAINYNPDHLLLVWRHQRFLLPNLDGNIIAANRAAETLTGYNDFLQEFRMNYKKNGEVTYEGTRSDIGKSRIDGDLICWQYPKISWGVEFCGSVFREPGRHIRGERRVFLMQ